MDVFIIYIFHQVIFRIAVFLRHWYRGGFFSFARAAIAIGENMDKQFALKVTLHNLFKPLYQDGSVIGYVLGFVFRFFRIITAVLLYLILAGIFLALYLLWAAIPLYIVFKIMGGNVNSLKWI